LFFEIYGGAGPFHLAYQLEGKEKDGRFVALGKPQESDATERGQGFELPTSAKWPAGAYRLTVTVVDVAGTRTSGSIAFTLSTDAAP
jgi:methionine-rich copper-binding protein CopC